MHHTQKIQPSPGSSLCGLLFIGGLSGVFGYYLYNVEQNTQCYADGSSNTPLSSSQTNSDSVNVSENFQIIIALHFWTFIITIVQEILRSINFKLESDLIRSIVSAMGLAHIVQLVAFIMLHVYRLRHAGRVCAGDFLSESDKQNSEITALYLDRRGEFLWGWLLANWILMGLCCGCGLIACLFICKKA